VGSRLKAYLQAKLANPQFQWLAANFGGGVPRRCRNTRFEGHQANIGASIGISLAPIDGMDPEALLRCADLALYRAKGQGRGDFVFFESEMTASAHYRRVLELELREALMLRQFEAHYQPQINVKTGLVSGAEALIRWRHPVRGSLRQVNLSQ
jgi:predicted signal transduction protein with EAL and GGDEF domain